MGDRVNSPFDMHESWNAFECHKRRIKSVDFFKELKKKMWKQTFTNLFRNKRNDGFIKIARP